MKTIAVTKSAVWWGAGVASVGVMVLVLWVTGSERFWTNGGEIKARGAGVPLRHVLWLPAKPVPSVSDADQYEPKVSADGLTMVFVRRRAGSNADLMEARWTPTGWSEATAIEAVNTEHDELGPELSRDGKSLYFYSDRPGGLGGYDIWVSKFVDGKWDAANNLGATVNSSANEYGPALSADGKSLYFSSNRLRAGEPVSEADVWPATMREKRSRHDYDLYCAAAEMDGWANALALEGLNTAFDEGAPAASPAGDFLYFASDRPGGLGGFDLYRSRIFENRPFADRVGEAENLGDAVNSTSNDLDAGLSADGFRLYFSSDRATAGATMSASGEGKGAAPIGGREWEPKYSLWSTASREVFVETESGDRWARMMNFFGLVWPWVGALLLALIPLLLLWWMLRNELWRRRLGQLSLLAQCLLISLLIHALITAGLAVWKVGSGIAEVMRSGGGTRVVLASSGAAGDLVGQLGAPAMQTPAMELPALAIVASENVFQSSIAAPKSAELPAAVTPASERMRVSTATSAEGQLSALKTLEAPVAAPAISAATPAASRQSEASEAKAEPATMAALPTAVSASPSVSLKEVAVPQVVIPASGAVKAERMQTAIAAAPEATDSARTFAPGPAARVEIEKSAMPLPRAMGTTVREATMEAPAGAASPSFAAPAAAFSPAVQSASVPLPAITVGAASRLPTSIGTTDDVSVTESGKVASGSGPSGLSASTQSVTANLPVAAAPKSGGAGAREATATMSAGMPRQASAPVGISGVKGVEVGNVPLPGVSSAKPERLSTSGFGGASGIEPAPSLGGAVISADVLGSGLASIGSSRLPADIAEPVKPVERFEQRQPEARGEMLAKMGGSAETEKAVGLALEWFAKHQDADGHWSGKNFDAHCGKCAGKAEIDADAAMTGIVLLCYLGAGHTHMADGPYREPIARALKWLVDRQAASGDLRRGETMYGQTLSTVAMCEALAMTKDQKLAGPTRRAVEFVLRTAASRDGARREEDTSVLGWLVMTVESARRAGIAVPRDVFEGAGNWLESASSGTPGRYAYARGGAPSAAMTAEAMFVQQILGHSRDEVRMKESAAFILSNPPKWDGAAPTYHWYYATLALFQHQGDAWDRWNRQLSPILVEHQRRDGTASGSWDPQDEWSRLGGRLYQTAVCTLSLEVYYRYKPK
ncbi:MAG: hypothetical protein ACREJD_04085 [Phycisphaerales bacterium]